MTSRREDILAAMMTRLANTSGIGSPARVYRSRVVAMRTDKLPAITVEPLQESAQYDNLNFMTWTLQVSVKVFTRGEAPDQLADPIINSAYALLMADRSLGGLALDVLPSSIGFSAEDGDKPLGMADCVFTVTYRTNPVNLES